MNELSSFLTKHRLFILVIGASCIIIYYLSIQLSIERTQQLTSGLDNILDKIKLRPSKADVTSSEIGEEINCSQDITDYKQDDPQLVEIVKECYLIKPSSKEYNLVGDRAAMRGQFLQPEIVSKLYNRQLVSEGFYIECGGYDGETISNTLFFEKKENWDGLLVEPDPANFKTLIGKQRKVWASNTCLSTKDQPMKIGFAAAGSGGRLDEGSISTLEVTCLPLVTLLLALGSPSVHYFSLDVEGAELQILRTIPWDLVDIWLLDIEIAHDPVGRIEMRHILEENGYEYIGTVFEYMNTLDVGTDPCNCTAIDDFYFLKSKKSILSGGLYDTLTPLLKDENFKYEL